jgi:hypothetical protein
MLAKIIIYTRVHRVPAPAGPTLLAGVHGRTFIQKTCFTAPNCSHRRPETGAFPTRQAVEPAFKPLSPCTRMYIAPQRQLGLALPGMYTRVHASIKPAFALRNCSHRRPETGTFPARRSKPVKINMENKPVKINMENKSVKINMENKYFPYLF